MLYENFYFCKKALNCLWMNSDNFRTKWERTYNPQSIDSVSTGLSQKFNFLNFAKERVNQVIQLALFVRKESIVLTA